MNDNALKDRILSENQQAHDYFAPKHDSVCSYISRKRCRDYYSAMILNLCRWNQRDLAGCAVLELGCGTGTWTSLFSGAKEFVGVDISPGMIAEANRKYSDSTRLFYCSDVVTFLEGEVAKGRKYDVIISSSFLHHLFDIDQVIDLIAKVLNQAGIYLALHEPIKPLTAHPFSHPLGKRADERLAYLMGFDCDLQQNPPLRRILKTLKMCIPFKNKLKKLVGRGSPSKNLPHSQTISYVDYKLTDKELFHPVIFANKQYEGLTVSFDIYSYYTYPELAPLFGEISNYFYVSFCKKIR